ncbi:hypothetical protein B0H10DRAFT_825470 [Mycena sp. CBHHK59/15]|nr:hypothetical protein B0H10DRAFT_825470 [Mycena sp. CBHHK59/15]
MVDVPSPAAQPQDGRSTFQRALDRYIQGLPEKKKKRKFIVACCATDASITPDSINESIKKAEQRNSEQPGKRAMKKVLGPVVDVLRDYDAIISSLASADPMPTAIIWGALKVIIDGAHRFLNLFDIIKKELRALASQLQRINDYESLYGDSDMLQELFCQSYVNMLRFWSRVDKECDTCWYTSMLKAVASFSTSKLNKIIQDIEEDANQIEKLASILEATKGKEERQAAELERFKAGMERAAAQRERQTQAAWREENQSDRQEERYRHICAWLCCRQGNEENMRQHRAHKNSYLTGTCNWILQDPTYIEWHSGRSKPAILWVHAPPAAGKSILSSHVLEAIKQSDTVIAVAYHFYRFDQMNSASETLRLLAGHLFDHYWELKHEVMEEMYLKTQRSVCSLESVQELITALVTVLPKSCFVLDGLDEECMGARWTEAATVLDFLINLAKDSPDRVWLWYSSQYRPCINEKLKAHPILDIKDEVKKDVSFYLSRVNPELNDLEVSDADLQGVLQDLQGRAEGNFLWASLMLQALKNTDSLTDMKEFAADGLPETLDDYYRRIFERFEKPQRSLVSKIFALIAFARRPLKMKEIREAVGLLQSKNPRSLDPADMPFISRMRKLFPPLIEMQEEGCADIDDCTCRLFHSTVREFLYKNPGILQAGLTGDPAADLLVGPYVIANACLLYLCQARYSRPLTKRDARWLDASGKSADHHQFLLYAAKYWDKHLDAVMPSEELRDRVGAFITSSNFQTCLQVQSLWVDAQFGVFRLVGGDDAHTFLRRVFPAWFVLGTPAGMRLWQSFRGFLHDWKYFLHRPRYEDPGCVTLPYTGELDRCWWTALGPENFLSKLKCRYTTFRFQKGDGADPANGGQCVDGVGAEGKELRILRLKSRKLGALEFTCERWCCDGSRPPTLERTQTIWTDEKTTNWRLYVRYPTDEESNIRVGRAWPAAFSQSNQFLRIGTQLFSRNEMDDYVPLPGFNAAQPHHPAYIEEFANRGSVTVVASRRQIVAARNYDSGLPDDRLDGFGLYFLKLETTSAGGRWKGSRLDADAESSDDSDSSTESEDGGYESWSEGSTEHSEDLLFEEDVITPWAGPLSDMDGDERAHSSDSESSEVDSLKEDEVQKDDSQTSVDSDSDTSDIDPSAVVGYGQWHDADKDDAWTNDEDDQESSDSEYGRPRRAPKQQVQSGIEASISVFDSSSGAIPMKIFHFHKSLPFLLYGSPPVIHPSKSLVVWPLSAGDVLFADFLAKTYFIRKLRPSTLHTRHIFMKCQFSPCGNYIHFASLEGQKRPVSRRQKKDIESDQPPVKLALLLSTYRLSTRKTSRSPPTLVRRVRLYLGSESALLVSKLPYTLTWTPTELYFTCSDRTLKVYRIPLFESAKETSGKEPSVLMPRKLIFLPETAEKREVYYFPPENESTTARVIISSETRGRPLRTTNIDDQFSKRRKNMLYLANYVFGFQRCLSPPMGCYLNESTDLGGWCKSYDRSKIPEDLGIGQLDRRLEKFDPEDDCDLEPYVF